MPNTVRKLLLGLLGGSSDPSASFTVTTTGAQTLTINALTVSASTTVDWGDNSSDAYTGAGARTHNYAGAGTWRVRILQPLNVTVLTLNSTGIPIVLNSAGLRGMLNMSLFQANNLPAGSSGTFNSVDVAEWRPLNFSLFGMPAGYSGTWNSAAVSGWNPALLNLAFMPASYAFTLSAADFSGWVATSSFKMNANALSQAQVDACLLGLYIAAQSRTGINGVIELHGSNAAPSGTYEATCPPLTGKAAAYELINDSCGVIAAGETWTTITVTGGLP
jgi:hypothetical protein